MASRLKLCDVERRHSLLFLNPCILNQPANSRRNAHVIQLEVFYHDDFQNKEMALLLLTCSVLSVMPVYIFFTLGTHMKLLDGR